MASTELQGGHSLTAMLGESVPTPSAVYLRTANGSGVELLPYSRAEELLRHVTASPVLHVTGDLATGFAWPIPGAIPRWSTAVIPLAAPTWPHSPFATAATIELWWPTDASGYRKVRNFLGFFNDPFDAYLTACCLWAIPASGRGAEAAFLYGPGGRTVYRISEFARTCSQIPAELAARIAATTGDRDTTDPLPDSPRSATAIPKEERVP